MKAGVRKQIVAQINRTLKDKTASNPVAALLFMKLIICDDTHSWDELFKVFCAKAHIKDPEPVVAPDPYDRGGK